jgi:hypothetical protein
VIPSTILSTPLFYYHLTPNNLLHISLFQIEWPLFSPFKSTNAWPSARVVTTRLTFPHLTLIKANNGPVYSYDSVITAQVYVFSILIFCGKLILAKRFATLFIKHAIERKREWQLCTEACFVSPTSTGLCVITLCCYEAFLLWIVHLSWVIFLCTMQCG